MSTIRKLLEKWETEIRRGAIQLLVCAVLNEENMHGTEICDTILDKTDQLIEVPLGTVYPLLRRFINEGLVETYKPPEDRRKTIYMLNSTGVQYYTSMRDQWLKYSVAVNNVLHA